MNLRKVNKQTNQAFPNWLTPYKNGSFKLESQPEECTNIVFVDTKSGTMGQLQFISVTEGVYPFWAMPQDEANLLDTESWTNSRFRLVRERADEIIHDFISHMGTRFEEVIVLVSEKPILETYSYLKRYVK